MLLAQAFLYHSMVKVNGKEKVQEGGGWAGGRAGGQAALRENAFMTGPLIVRWTLLFGLIWLEGRIYFALSSLEFAL